MIWHKHLVIQLSFFIGYIRARIEWIIKKAVVLGSTTAFLL
jgi:hypothetical protein